MGLPPTEDGALALASPNIALIKYWGKSDAEQNLPLNASLSLTARAEVLCTTTRARFVRPEEEGGTPGSGAADHCPRRSAGHGPVSLVLDGVRQPPPKRLARVAELLGSLSPLPGLSDRASRPSVCLESSNSFPTGCGLASSASGACAAVRALDALYQTQLDSFSLAALARYVSGSGARSVFPGAVLTVELWGNTATQCAEKVGASEALRASRGLAERLRGTPFAGMLDWTAVPLPVHPELRSSLTGLVAVLDPSPKKVGSTAGMLAVTSPQGSAALPGESATAGLLAERLRSVPSRLAAVAAALERGDFAAAVPVSEEDWQEMHRLVDASLGSSYLTTASWAVYAAIRAWREEHEGLAVLVTFDAGPNPCIICNREAKGPLKALLSGLAGDGGERLVKRLIDMEFDW